MTARLSSIENRARVSRILLQEEKPQLLAFWCKSCGGLDVQYLSGDLRCIWNHPFHVPCHGLPN